MGFSAATKLGSTRAFCLSHHQPYHQLPHCGHRDQLWCYPSGLRQHAFCSADHVCAGNFPALFRISAAAAGTTGIINQVDSCVHRRLPSSAKTSPQTGLLKLDGAGCLCVCPSSREGSSTKNFGPLRMGHDGGEKLALPKALNLHVGVYRHQKFRCLCMGSDGKQNMAGYKRTRTVDNVLVAAEGICLIGAVASQTACCLSSYRLQQASHTSILACESPALSNYIRLSAWQVLPLSIALVINVILRARQFVFGQGFGRNEDNIHSLDSNLALKVKNLEEDLGNGLTIMRSLTRQVEKLGIRFRVTRRTLRDPIQETALLNQKTLDTVRDLIKRHDKLEEELKSIHKALLAMQEQQIKQLDLVSKVIGRVSRIQKPMPSPVSTSDQDLSVDNSKQILEEKSLNRASLERRPAGLQELAEKLEDVRKSLRQWRDVAVLGESNGREAVHNVQTNVNSSARNLARDIPSLDTPSTRYEASDNGQTKTFATPRIDFWTTPLHET